MPIDVSFLAPAPQPKDKPKIPKGDGYRYDPVDYDSDEWVLTYQYTFEDQYHVRLVFKDTHGGSHVRMIWKGEAKEMKDF